MSGQLAQAAGMLAALLLVIIVVIGVFMGTAVLAGLWVGVFLDVVGTLS